MQKEDSEQEFEENKEDTQLKESESQEDDQSSDQSDSQDGDNERKTKWTEGDPVTYVRVRFPGNSKTFPFIFGKRRFAYGQKVVAMSDRGMTVGYINSLPYTVPFQKSMLPIKSIVKAATDEDIQEQKGHSDAEKKAEVSCINLINKLELDMVLTHVEFTQFGKKAVFYFTAPARVDFRELVKQLVAELKMRIELRQISVRDRAAALGGIGACGLQTCCSSFLKNYGHVSIKMAKNQNLALIPSKINGVCGQLKCCIKYEDDVYGEKRKKLPKESSFIQTKNGDKGKVTKLHILLEQFEMLTDEGKFRRYVLDQYVNGKRLDKEYRFPERFDHIVNETSEIIGFIPKETKTAFDPFYDVEEDDDEIESDEDGEDEIESEEESENNDKTSGSDKNDEKQDRNRSQNRNRNRNRNRNKGQSSKEDNQSDNQDSDKKKSRNNRNRNRNRNRNKNKGNNQNPKKSE